MTVFAFSLVCLSVKNNWKLKHRKIVFGELVFLMYALFFNASHLNIMRYFGILQYLIGY